MSNPYTDTTTCRFDYSNNSTYHTYVPCPDLYQGWYEQDQYTVFFLREGTATTAERWENVGAQKIRLNKKAMKATSMGKIFRMSAGTPNSDDEAPLYTYTVSNGQLAVHVQSEFQPLYIQDTSRGNADLSYETFNNYLTSPVDLNNAPRYWYWRYNDGDAWTRIDTGVEQTHYVSVGVFPDGNGGEYTTFNYLTTADSGNYPNGTSEIQITFFDATSFTTLEEWTALDGNYPFWDIKITNVGEDGGWYTYTATQVIDAGSYYEITLNTTDDIHANKTKYFEPEASLVYTYEAHDTSGDPADKVGAPYGTYTVKNGVWSVQRTDSNGRIWWTQGQGDLRHEAIWYWRYADEPGSEWTQHTQTTGVTAGTFVDYIEDSTGGPWPNAGTGTDTLNIHFEATDQTSNFPDGVKTIELTSSPRITDWLFVVIGEGVLDRSRLVLPTAKSELFGNFFVTSTSIDPNASIGEEDEFGVFTYTTNTPTREGQVIVYTPTDNEYAAILYVAVDIEGQLYWKQIN